MADAEVIPCTGSEKFHEKETYSNELYKAKSYPDAFNIEKDFVEARIVNVDSKPVAVLLKRETGRDYQPILKQDDINYLITQK